MKFSAIVVGAFAALASAQGSAISSAVSSALSSGASSVSSDASSVASSVSSRASSLTSSAASSGAAASSTSSVSSTSSEASSSASSSGSATSSGEPAVITSTVYYQYPNTFHKPVSPTLLGSTVITSTEGQSASSLSLPSGASTFGVTVSNITTTYTSHNTFHKAVSSVFTITTTYATTEGFPTSSSSSEGAAARFGAGEIGAFGAFALGAAALL